MATETIKRPTTVTLPGSGITDKIMRALSAFGEMLFVHVGSPATIARLEEGYRASLSARERAVVDFDLHTF